MNSLISLRRATKNDLKFLELIYNDKTIQDISLKVRRITKLASQETEHTPTRKKTKCRCEAVYRITS